MTGTERLVARALADHRANLDAALRAIRDYQAALTALDDMPGASGDARVFALEQAAALDEAWAIVDLVRWAVPPFPGTRDT